MGISAEEKGTAVISFLRMREMRENPEIGFTDARDGALG